MARDFCYQALIEIEFTSECEAKYLTTVSPQTKHLGQNKLERGPLAKYQAIGEGSSQLREARWPLREGKARL